MLLLFFLKYLIKVFERPKNLLYLHRDGELAEWSNAAVLKTVEGHTSRGSNPLLSAKSISFEMLFLF